MLTSECNCHQESFLNRAEREGKFEALLERNKDRINELTDVRQDLDLELLKIKFSGRCFSVHCHSCICTLLLCCLAAGGPISAAHVEF